LNNKLNIKI